VSQYQCLSIETSPTLIGIIEKSNETDHPCVLTSLESSISWWDQMLLNKQREINTDYYRNKMRQDIKDKTTHLPKKKPE